MLADGEDFLGTQGATETGVAVLVGTPGYMPPEQVLGERPAIAWDLWALAVVAYEILTGALPFPVTSREAWMRTVLAGTYTPLDQHLPDSPASWREFFTRSLALDRTRRPPSAPAFIEQLERALVSSIDAP